MYDFHTELVKVRRELAQQYRQRAADLLGVDVAAGDSEIRGAYRRLARESHPDMGGDAVRFNALTRAKDEMLIGDASLSQQEMLDREEEALEETKLRGLRLSEARREQTRRVRDDFGSTSSSGESWQEREAREEKAKAEAEVEYWRRRKEEADKIRWVPRSDRVREAAEAGGQAAAARMQPDSETLWGRACDRRPVPQLLTALMAPFEWLGGVIGTAVGLVWLTVIGPLLVLMLTSSLAVEVLRTQRAGQVGSDPADTPAPSLLWGLAVVAALLYSPLLAAPVVAVAWLAAARVAPATGSSQTDARD